MGLRQGDGGAAGAAVIDEAGPSGSGAGAEAGSGVGAGGEVCRGRPESSAKAVEQVAVVVVERVSEAAAEGMGEGGAGGAKPAW